MSRRRITVKTLGGCILILASATNAYAEEVAAPAAPAAHSAEISAAPVGRDWSVLPDFAALRRELGSREDFGALCDHPVAQGSELLDRKAWPELLALTEAWLTRCPIDVDGHILRSSRCERPGGARKRNHITHGSADSWIRSSRAATARHRRRLIR
jgi:hypothetical protein